MVFLKDVFEKVDFEKNRRCQKHEKLPEELIREHSGRVVDLRPWGHGFEPHLRHCVVSFIGWHSQIGIKGITQFFGY